jgi:hypothetical protein
MLRDPARLLDQREHRLDDLPLLVGQVRRINALTTHAETIPAAAEITADTPSDTPLKHPLTDPAARTG